MKFVLVPHKFVIPETIDLPFERVDLRIYQRVRLGQRAQCVRAIFEKRSAEE